MSETIENQLAHRSVRRFDAQPISPQVLAQLKEATRRTATSCGGANGFDYSGERSGKETADFCGF